jgi:hypothetical protein
VEPCRINVGIFKVHETLGATMAIQLKDLIVHYDFLHKVITYVKDESANMNTFTMALISIFVTTTLATSCYELVMSKCCQHVINDLKMCGGMKEVSKGLIFFSKDNHFDKKKWEWKVRMGEACK